MKKLYLILCFVLAYLIFPSFSYAELPSQYYPNAGIENNMDRIVENFSRLQAYRGTSSEVPTQIFSELSQDFEEVFPNFPQTPDNRVVFEQCNITTNSLMEEYSYDGFLTFLDRCFEEVNSILQDIDANYTVVPNIQASPTEGSAPLNVTLDARGSMDPSNDTIPSNNFFWHYRDSDGNERIIGQGPVVNHTFEEEGNYVVHLTVRSVNNQSHGVFDGSESVNIAVSPQSAVLSAYLNGDRLDTESHVKVGTQEAQNGIVIDGSGSYPTGGRTIEETRWEIRSDEGFSHNHTTRGSPGSFRISLPDRGQYYVRLIISDNENNEVVKEYPFTVSDPVAKIRANPEEGDTSTNFNFDASASYSIESSIQTYRWTIFDPDGNQIDTYESRTFDREFNRPGNYNVRLVAIDQQGRENEEVFKLNVESTKPVPQFRVIPTQDWDKPSMFVLDARGTYDIDEINGFAELEYDWNFSNSSNVEVIRSFDNGERLLVSFEEAGEYDVVLNVRDSFGKSNSVERNIEVESSLRPELSINPFATQIGENINFEADANKSVSYYEWDFGDGNTRQTQSTSNSQSYSQAGVYDVSLSASTPSGEENTIRRQVFIGQKGYPTAAYSIEYDGTVLSPESKCEVEDEDGEMVEVDAFEIDRYQDIEIDARESINSHGRKDDLSISFRPQNAQRTNADRFSHDFNEMGCTYIELAVEDRNVNKIDRQKIWFDVQNALPELDNIEMKFPQYGNEVGVGFGNQQTSADIFETDYDPLIVQLSARGANDPDGHISHFIRYYYKASNPDRILEVKTSPYNVPNTVFSIPRMPGEFIFGVRMVDNDGGEIDSEEIIGKGPSLFFPPSTENPDIPIVSASIDSRNISVGDEVTFNVDARILGSADDFQANRTIRYDFNGDGNYDLTTKSDRVTHVYEEAGEFRPRVKVSYRGYAGVDRVDKIEVRQGLRVGFVSDNIGKKAIFRDISIGSIENTEFCLDVSQCRRGNSDLVFQNEELIFHEYEDYSRKPVSLRANDEFGNHDEARDAISLTGFDEDIGLMSIPNNIYTGGSYEIDVGSRLNNNVDFYAKYNGTGDCYIDFDITYDSTGDGQADNDRDLDCNELGSNEYTPQANSTIARLYYEDSSGELNEKDILINFLDFDIDLPEEVMEIYQDLTDIINSLDSDSEQQNYLRTLLMSLRNSIGAGSSVDSLVIQVYDWVDENLGLLELEKEERLLDILDYLTDTGIEAARGANEYELAKSNIIMFMPDDTEPELESLFSQIEGAEGNQEMIRSSLQEILNLANSEYESGNIDGMDFNIIQSDICEIMDYYGILSELCGTLDEPDEDFSESEGGIVDTILRVLIYLLITIVALFVILVVVFAFKARSQGSEYSDEEEDDEDEENSK